MTSIFTPGPGVCGAGDAEYGGGSRSVLGFEATVEGPDNAPAAAAPVVSGRHTAGILLQNITLALGIKAIFLVLAVAGQATLWMAVFADMGLSLMVVANGLRLLRK